MEETRSLYQRHEVSSGKLIYRININCRFGTEFSVPKHGCLINIYEDGSVVVGTSGIYLGRLKVLIYFVGTDMGQGLNTKLVQAVSNFLGGIPMELITIRPTSTFRILTPQYYISYLTY